MEVENDGDEGLKRKLEVEKKDIVGKETENKKVMRIDDGEVKKVVKNETIKEDQVVRQKVVREVMVRPAIIRIPNPKKMSL